MKFLLITTRYYKSIQIFILARGAGANIKFAAGQICVNVWTVVVAGVYYLKKYMRNSWPISNYLKIASLIQINQSMLI